MPEDSIESRGNGGLTPDFPGAARLAFEASKALEACLVVSPPCDAHRDPAEVLSLLRQAAAGGEPRAHARMLLFRDIGAEKGEALEKLPYLLASANPEVVRDVGAFLARGEESKRLGEEEVSAPAFAIAWELAACDLGDGCGKPLHEIALEASERPEDLAQARRLRSEIVRAVRTSDWLWLGLAAVAAPVQRSP